MGYDLSNGIYRWYSTDLSSLLLPTWLPLEVSFILILATLITIIKPLIFYYISVYLGGLIYPDEVHHERWWREI